MTELLAIAVVAPILPAPAAAAPCRPPEIAALAASPSPSGLVLLPVTIDGRPATFELDTGADFSLVSGAEAAALGLRPQTAPHPLLVGADGRPLSQYVVARELALGGIRRDGVRLVLIPQWTATDPTATGLLGGDLVSGFDLELDLAGSRVAFHRADACPGRLAPFPTQTYGAAMDVAEGHAVVTVTLDGRRLQALIDTGATQSSLPLALAGRLFGLRAGAPGVAATAGTVTSDGGRLVTYRHRFASLSLAGLALGPADIDLVARTENPNVAGDHDMVLGLPELRRMRLYLAYRSRRLYVAPAAG